jgi:hypothetical protein
MDRITGIFTEQMRDYFGAEEGAYTEFAESELGKSTYNVKSVIRNLLIEKIGRDNIPKARVTENQEITFKICEKAKIYETPTLNIACKFSKPDRDEMSIYFTNELIRIMNVNAGDIWYIYFESTNNSPVLGVMSREKWNNLFEDVEDIEDQEPDENGSHELNYSSDITRMSLKEVEAPERSELQRMGRRSTVRSISAEEAARCERNKKIKGNRGEEIAIEIERRRLSSLDREDLISKITHVAKYKDGLGYDLISTDVDENGYEQEIYIEVKVTAGNVNMPFYVSQRELEISQQYQRLYYIYRIFNMKENNEDVQYYRLNGAIDDNFDLVNTEYLAYRSNN